MTPALWSAIAVALAGWAGVTSGATWGKVRVGPRWCSGIIAKLSAYLGAIVAQVRAESTYVGHHHWLVSTAMLFAFPGLLGAFVGSVVLPRRRDRS